MTTNQWQRWKGIMKCYPFEEKRLSKWTPPYIVQPKYDGIRCRVIPIAQENGTSYLLLSSEENPIFGVPHLNEMFNKLNLSCELDGELYCHGMAFEEIVSITSRTNSLHHNHQAISYYCFDVIDGNPQYQRLLFIEGLKNLHEKLVISPFYLCNSLDDVLKAYDEIINQGYEGIIVRHIANMYERKRSTWVMKFKPKKEDEYEIVDFKEELTQDGIPKDTLGAIVCKSGNREYFSVGTGFTEERRKQLWEARDLLVGQFAKVKYQHITSGKGVPRFPVFVDVVVKP